jgi:hypothetical protein
VPRQEAKRLGGIAKTVQEENPVGAPLLHVDRLRTLYGVVFGYFFRDHPLR